jgi:hypothetical protein
MSESAPPVTDKLVPRFPRIIVRGTDAYFGTVVRLIDVIGGTKTGGAVLDNIIGGAIRIEPEPDAEACDPESGSLVNHDRCEVMAAAAVIKFSPRFAKRASRRSGLCREIWMEGDEVLLHELVHAMRAARKVQDCRELGRGLASFDSREEFFAVLIENIYRSERRLGKAFKGKLDAQVPLRRNHRLGRMFAGEAQAFNKDLLKLELVLTLWNDPRMEAMCRKISAVETAFNPLRWALAKGPRPAMRSIADAPVQPRI